MPGFTKTVSSGGASYVVQPPALNFGKFRCTRTGCSFTSEFQGALTMHVRSCGDAERPPAGRAVALADSDGDESDDGESDGDEPGGGARGVRRRDEPRLDGRMHNRGAAQRLTYTFAWKADALDAYAAACKEGETAESVEARLGLPSGAGMLSKWLKKAESIYAKASAKLTRSLTRSALRACAGSARYPAVELRLVAEIKRYRGRGRHLSIRWLVTKARALFDGMYPDEAGTFRASRSWRRRFSTRHHITRLKPTNTKSKSVDERLGAAHEFHQKFALLISSLPPGISDAEMDDVFGRFLLENRANMDQVALPFLSAADLTLEFIGAGRVHTKAQAEALLKRQATIILHFFGRNPLNRDVGQLGLIFRGMGKVASAEKAAYDPRVCVQFQRKAWMDRPAGLEWIQRVWEPLVKKLPCGEKLLLLDNLDAHVDMPFRAALRANNTLAWFLPPGCTDFLQPVDAGAGRTIVSLYMEAQDIWLDKDENLELWETCKLTASQRRILMTQWLGAAWDKFNSAHFDRARFRWFEKTGALMTADGSRDDQITPEGTQSYRFERLDGEAAVAAAAAAASEAANLPTETVGEPDSDDDVPAPETVGDDGQDYEFPPLGNEAASLAQAEAPDDAELELLTFAEMVKLALSPGEQLHLLSGPPTLDRSLVGKTVAVRIVDVGWCAGTVVYKSSSPKVKSFNFAVRFDAEDVMELWLKPERYVSVSTANADNAWAGLDKAMASSWTLYGVSTKPRAPAARFVLTDAAREAARAIALPRPPPPPPRATADAPHSAAPPRASEPPAPLRALRASGAQHTPLAVTPALGAGAAVDADADAVTADEDHAVRAALVAMLTYTDECTTEALLERLRGDGHLLRPGKLHALMERLSAENRVMYQDETIYKI
jgi:hypothetical protein